MLRRHLERAYAVGVFASAWGSKFICFDVDDGKHETVAKLIDTLEGVGIPRRLIYVSFSGGKGYHVEVFFDEQIETRRLRDLYERIIAGGDFDPRKVEFRPTNTAAIKLPLSIHAKTGNICWFVDRESLEPIEDDAFILGIERMPAGEFAMPIPAQVQKQDEQREKSAPERARATDVSRNLGTVLREKGTRHNMARNIAVYLRMQGKTREECLTSLREWYEAQDPNLMRSDPSEAIRDVTELVEWTFSERFSLPPKREKDTTLIGSTQMNLVLSQKSRTTRRVLFLLLTRCRMGRPAVSCKDVSKTIGVSLNAVDRAMKRLKESGAIERDCGNRLHLPDGSFYSESSRYTVPHAEGSKDESRINVVMRELTFNFDHCYNRALHALIPRYALKKALSRDEWAEYERYAAEEGSEIEIVNERRIDLTGIPKTLRHERYGELTAYEIGGRFLYPAYDCAKRLGISDPSAAGSMCPHKESWHVRVVRRILEDGRPSYQISNKNFIPAEDVNRLAARGNRVDRDEVVKWILSPESDAEGASA